MKRIVQGALKDVSRIMDCAREMTGNIPDCPLNEAHYTQQWRRLLLSGAGAMFLLEDGGEVVGGIGGICHPDLLTDRLVAAEMFWYVKPAHRGGTWAVRLLKAYEAWAKSQGCYSLSIGHTAHLMPERLKEFYLRRGYTPNETNYRKTL